MRGFPAVPSEPGNPVSVFNSAVRIWRARRVTLLTGIFFSVIATALLRAGTNEQTTEPSPSEPILGGRRVFETKGCVQCHTVGEGRAENQVGPDLAEKAASWSDLMRFAGMLWNHLPEMSEEMHLRAIERVTFSPEEMGKLTAYLFHVKLVGPPGDANRGRDLFEQRLCVRCHQFKGRGGTVGPRLDELKNFSSAFFLARTLWNHGPEMADKMKELGITQLRLGTDDVSDIVAFLRNGAGTPAPLELAYTASGTPRLGEILFREKGCARCHASAGSGGTIGPDLIRRTPNLNISELAGAFWNHGAPMRAKMKELGVPYPVFSDADMSNLIAYLAFIQYSGPRGDPTKGKEIFREKSCSECHPVAGEGPKVGPDLASSDATRSVPDWAAAMWNHAPAMGEKLREVGRAWPHFDADEMRDVVEFLRSRSVRSASNS